MRAAAITLAFCFGCTLANGEDAVRVARIFSAKDITTVIFRSGAAKQTKILRVYGDTIRVTGKTEMARPTFHLHEIPSLEMPSSVANTSKCWDTKKRKGKSMSGSDVVGVTSP